MSQVKDELVIQETRWARYAFPDQPSVERQRVDLTWTTWRPLEIVLLLHVGGNCTVDWVFSRDLLVNGGGDGDVNVRINAVHTVITLESPTGYVEVQLSTALVARFVGRIARRVPLDQEVAIDDDEFQEELERHVFGQDGEPR